MAPLKVIIVGGGLGGALLANGLLNNGVDATLFERDDGHSKREGYQIRLGDGATTGMQACLEPSHLDSILAKLGRSSGGGSTAPAVYNSQFQMLLNLSSLPSYSKTSAINRVVLRDMLIQPVVAKGRVKFCKSFVSYDIAKESMGRDRVLVRFTDGSSELCDILVGADGSSSKINKALGLDNLVHIDTHWGFLKKGSLSAERVKLLPRQLRDGPILVFSGGAVMFYALYLPSTKDPHKGGKVDELDFDSEAASYYWALNMPRSATKVTNPADIKDKLKFCLDFTAAWAPEFHSMLTVGESDANAGDIMVTPLRASTKPSHLWRQNAITSSVGDSRVGHPQVWLLGDAVHAMQPNRGQGGNQAMHDCADMLQPILELHELSTTHDGLSRNHYEQALAKYEPTMIDRAFYWVKASGGASVPEWNLDGYLGTLIAVVGWAVLPVIRIVYGLVYGASK